MRLLLEWLTHVTILLYRDDTYNETLGINGTVWSGCGWRVSKKVKTIDSKCLENHGFYNACSSDFGKLDCRLSHSISH